jgi:hypothetical protein
MPTATPEARTAPASTATQARARAFGLELDSAFPIPGAATPAGDGGDRRVRLELTSREDLLGAWSPAAPKRISDRRMANGRSAVAIDADPRAGYLIRAMGFGCFWISPDATRIRCAPLRVTTWRWQRYLVGQVLPLTAVLRGLEVFHASAVVGSGGALTFLGMSTAGKTSVALNLVLGGSRFMTDDVLAVSPAPDGGVLAHPGIGLASLRHDADARLQPAERRLLGRRLGRDGEATRVALDCQSEPVPLRHAFLLERSKRGPLAIERLRPVDPRFLLGGSFNFIITTPERLTNQLDLCARIANRVGVHRASIPPSVGPAELARSIEAYVEELDR